MTICTGGCTTSHHPFIRRRRHRLARHLFAGLLILLVVVALLYLIRRYNMRKAGKPLKPVTEDLGDVYRDLQNRFETGNYDGMIGDILGNQGAG